VSQAFDVQVYLDAKRRVVALNSIHGLPFRQVVYKKVGII
jgi:hypothetical protein